MKNHLVRGIVRSADLADDLVGPSAAFTKLRSNIYEAEDGDWREVKVSRIKMFKMKPIQFLIKGSDSKWCPGKKERLGGAEWSCSCCRQGSFPSHCWRSSSDSTGTITIS